MILKRDWASWTKNFWSPSTEISADLYSRRTSWYLQHSLLLSWWKWLKRQMLQTLSSFLQVVFLLVTFFQKNHVIGFPTNFGEKWIDWISFPTLKDGLVISRKSTRNTRSICMIPRNLKIAICLLHSIHLISCNSCAFKEQWDQICWWVQCPTL